MKKQSCKNSEPNPVVVQKRPKTGLPLQGIKSVTVISPSAELSDALATAVYVMGVNQGIEFIDQLPDTHCIIIGDNNAHYFSKNLDLKHEKQH